MNEVSETRIIVLHASLVKKRSKSITKNEAYKPRHALPETRFDHMPDVVIGKIMSYLHWLEREWLVLAIPSMARIINSPLAWENFENDRTYPIDVLHMYYSVIVTRELIVIQRYGRYFQSCSIWLHSLVGAEECGDSDCLLLKAITENCTNLKLLSIMHPPDVTLTDFKSISSYYMKHIKSLAAKRGESFRLCLSRLFYSSVNTIATGIVSYLLYLQENDLLRHISCLDFSHGLVFDAQCASYMFGLVNCENISILKCPIHSVNTTIVLSMAKKKLKQLYLVNDDHTQEAGFLEKMYLDWEKISKELARKKKKKRFLMVHYIFRNRAMSHEDLHPNPLLHSLIFDNLSSNISAKLLRRIADQYGSTLRILAFCSNYWEFLMHFADLGEINESFKYLGRNCVQLTAFLSCLSLPSSALVCLVMSSRSVSTVRVFKENVRLATADKPEGVFLLKMARALGLRKWDMVKKGANIFKIPNVDCRLLFATCFNEF
ncbi:uncharacterized protein LOC106061445 [Biomphalaria glabrata]|uniref:Uncharacterized protein LOC106061445 n=1 Tax=Biomphalaria glabrata TaxID=6526 RepID=A0A9U8E7C0_BIOGL|nr:uncharacterized protein LOC106061445 [Biomphalaria glabrata]XP_013075049.2 uncharacterized protein LOC106061445 [Biomphalaria glabrata]